MINWTVAGTGNKRSAVKLCQWNTHMRGILTCVAVRDRYQLMQNRFSSPPRYLQIRDLNSFEQPLDFPDLLRLTESGILNPILRVSIRVRLLTPFHN